MWSATCAVTRAAPGCLVPSPMAAAMARCRPSAVVIAPAGPTRACCSRSLPATNRDERNRSRRRSRSCASTLSPSRACSTSARDASARNDRRLGHANRRVHRAGRWLMSTNMPRRFISAPRPRQTASTRVLRCRWPSPPRACSRNGSASCRAPAGRTCAMRRATS